jgi:hypothetical protein
MGKWSRSCKEITEGSEYLIAVFDGPELQTQASIVTNERLRIAWG